jgi:hypothetical protein
MLLSLTCRLLEFLGIVLICACVPRLTNAGMDELDYLLLLLLPFEAAIDQRDEQRMVDSAGNAFSS